jgi:hypothetical protein
MINNAKQTYIFHFPICRSPSHSLQTDQKISFSQKLTFAPFELLLKILKEHEPCLIVPSYTNHLEAIVSIIVQL